MDALVVGAGPSGLTTALYLASRGLKARIIDKNEHRSLKSKAIGVQAGTLELLGAVFGEELPHELVSAGKPVQRLHFHNDGERGFSADISAIPSKYNYILILEQSDTERILEARLARLGVRVERRHEMTEFTESATGVNAVINGERSEFAFLAGCDGAHSTTRKKLPAEFPGGSYDGSFLLADVKLDWPYDSDSLRVFLSARGAAAFFPFASGIHRIMVIPRDGIVATTSELDFREFLAEASAFYPSSIKARHPVWLARFRVHHRLASRFSSRRVFLVGDAAHIHSPVGAQGMNTGIHEALNLARKIERVQKGEAGVELLADYERERRPTAESVLKFTDLAFRTALLRESFATRALRKYLLPAVLGRRAVQTRIMRAVSEVDTARREMERSAFV